MDKGPDRVYILKGDDISWVFYDEAAAHRLCNRLIGEFTVVEHDVEDWYEGWDDDE